MQWLLNLTRVEVDNDFLYRFTVFLQFYTEFPNNIENFQNFEISKIFHIFIQNNLNYLK